MISYLFGKVKNTNGNFLVLEVNGVGYKIFIPVRSLSELKLGDELEVFTHFHVREDSQELYGFCTEGELQLFEQVLSVSSVGPKSAMNILNVGEADDIRHAIVSENAEFIASAPRVGKKTAERVIIELKSKIDLPKGKHAGNGQILAGEDFEDTLEVLIKLGFSRRQGVDVLKGIDPKLKVEEKVKQALKMLGKG